MRIYFLLLLLASTFGLCAQQTYPVRIIADARDGEVRLRWAPLDFETWALANRNGYRLERIVDGGPREVLAQALRPLPLEGWQAIGDTLELAMLYAGALYSESFENPTRSDGTQTVEDLNSVEQNRYSLALFAADQFFNVSLAAGLGYRDEAVSPGSRHLYLVTINGFTPPRGVPASGKIIVNTDDRTVLPPPATPTADWQDLRAKIGWDQSVTQNDYSSYRLERSAANGPFERVNALPLVYIETEENGDPKLYYQDSLAANDIPYRYRVRGRSPFGVLGPPSAEVSGQGLPGPLPFAPRISGMIQTPDNGLRIDWELPAGAEGKVKGFDVYRSLDGLNNYVKVNARTLPASTRSYVDEQPKSGYFYAVVLTDENDHEVSSPTGLLVLEDNDPPAPPVGVEGVMDTNGRVVLRWARNTEPDHQGYRVFISNQRDGRYIQLTKDAILETRYVHQVTMETTSETVYFAVKAIDYFGNYSLLSAPAEVARPDLIPPVGAVFRSLTGSTEGVQLEWAPSASRDVVTYAVERKIATENDDAYGIIYTTAEAPFTFFDDDTQRGQTYFYRIVVTDDAGWSTPGRPARAGRIDNGERAVISDFTAKAEAGGKRVVVTFTCAYPVDPTLFQLFRSRNGAPLATLRTLTLDDPDLERIDGQRYRFVDDTFKAGDSLEYRVLGKFEDGGFTPLSEPVEVVVPR